MMSLLLPVQAASQRPLGWMGSATCQLCDSSDVTLCCYRSLLMTCMLSAWQTAGQPPAILTTVVAELLSRTLLM